MRISPSMLMGFETYDQWLTRGLTAAQKRALTTAQKKARRLAQSRVCRARAKDFVSYPDAESRTPHATHPHRDIIDVRSPVGRPASRAAYN